MAIVETAEAGLRAAARGATMIQLRAPDRNVNEIEREAKRLKAESNLPVIVSSRCDVAMAADLDGVNLPERDISVADARRLLGKRIVSRSVHSRLGAQLAAGEGADFIIFGPVWESPSHPGGAAQGLDALREVAASVSVPVLGIGGVTEERVPDVLSACAGYAAISMFQ